MNLFPWSLVSLMLFMGGCQTGGVYLPGDLGSRLTQAQNDWRASGIPFRGDLIPPYDLSAQGEIQNILNRLVYVSPLRGYDIRVLLINDTSVNAQTDGRVIYLNVGLLRALGPDKDMIAAILAHELGHIIAYHAPVRRTRETLYRTALPFLGLTKMGAVMSLAVREVMTVSQAVYSRHEEKEADAIATLLCFEAKQDPYALSRFLQLSGRSVDQVFAPTSVPLTASADSAALAQSAALFLLRSSPLYKSHPPSQARKQVIEGMAQRKMGILSNEELRKRDPWLWKVYTTLEKRRPKKTP